MYTPTLKETVVSTELTGQMKFYTYSFYRNEDNGNSTVLESITTIINNRYMDY